MRKAITTSILAIAAFAGSAFADTVYTPVDFSSGWELQYLDQIDGGKNIQTQQGHTQWAATPEYTHQMLYSSSLKLNIDEWTLSGDTAYIGFSNGNNSYKIFQDGSVYECATSTWTPETQVASLGDWNKTNLDVFYVYNEDAGDIYSIQFASDAATTPVLQFWGSKNIGQIVGSNNKIHTSSSAVPEPSTYAAVFGALAIAFAVWRRRGRLNG